MRGFSRPLTDSPVVQRLKQIIVFSWARTGSCDVIHHARDVPEAESSRPHRIRITDRLALRAVPAESVVRRKAEPGQRVLLTNPRLENRPLFIRGLRLRKLLVAPHDRE